MKLGQNVFLDEILHKFENSETRSLGHIIEKSCVCFKGHIFENVCLDKISYEFENGSCGSKTRSLVQILGKPCVHSRDFISVQILVKLGQNVCLDDF